MTKPLTDEEMQNCIEHAIKSKLSPEWIKGHEKGRLVTIKLIRSMIPKCHDLNRLDQLLERMENE